MMIVDKLYCVNQLCLLKDPRYDYIGACEQRWIRNEIISELVNNVVSAQEVGSSAALLLCEESTNTVIPTYIGLSNCHDDRCYFFMFYHDLHDQNRQIVGCLLETGSKLS